MVSRFAAGLSKFDLKCRATVVQVFDGVVSLVGESIVVGSGITGAPGQPEDLRDGDWRRAPEGELVALVSTKDKSARSVEDGISYKHGTPLKKLKSSMGGFHSVKLTVAAGDRIVQSVVTSVTGKG